MIPVAAGFKSSDCGRSHFGVLGSNPVGGVEFVSCDYFLLPGRKKLQTKCTVKNNSPSKRTSRLYSYIFRLMLNYRQALGQKFKTQQFFKFFALYFSENPLIFFLKILKLWYYSVCLKVLYEGLICNSVRIEKVAIQTLCPFEIDFCLAVRFVCILHEHCTQREDSEQVCCCWPIIYVSDVAFRKSCIVLCFTHTAIETQYLLT